MANTLIQNIYSIVNKLSKSKSIIVSTDLVGNHSDALAKFNAIVNRDAVFSATDFELFFIATYDVNSNRITALPDPEFVGDGIFQKQFDENLTNIVEDIVRSVIKSDTKGEIEKGETK